MKKPIPHLDADDRKALSQLLVSVLLGMGILLLLLVALLMLALGIGLSVKAYLWVV